MSLQMSEREILEIAAERSLFVAKYGTNHEKLRKKCRRMMKDGVLVLMSANSRGFNYRTADAAYAIRSEMFALQPDAVEP